MWAFKTIRRVKGIIISFNATVQNFKKLDRVELKENNINKVIDIDYWATTTLIILCIKQWVVDLNSTQLTSLIESLIRLVPPVFGCSQLQ